MIFLLKYSSEYPNAKIIPNICLLQEFYQCFEVTNSKIVCKDKIEMKDELNIKQVLSNGNDILGEWIQCINPSKYSNRKNKYDILFLLVK